LTLYRHKKRKYVSVKPDDNGRRLIPDLELEVAPLDGWVRYWHLGELLPLPADLQRDLDEARRHLAEVQGQLDQTKGQLDQTKGQLDQTKGQLDAERKARLAAEQRLVRLRGLLARGPLRPEGP
jgi:adhesin HecA-like repeat protein